MSSRALCVLGCFAGAVGLPAQTSWQLEGGRAAAQVHGAERFSLEGAGRATAAAGPRAVHFAATAAGKPRSLALDVAAGSRVVIGVAGAAPAVEQPISLDGAGAFAGPLEPTWGAPPVQVRAAAPGAATARDGRLSAWVSRVEGARWFALAGRFSAGGGGYLFVLDWEEQEVRLERLLGLDRVVLARAPAPAPRREVAMALQLEGFRLQGILDEEVLVRAFDGAVSSGALGVAWAGEAPGWEGLRLAPPAKPAASVAVVQRGRAAQVYGAVPQQPGSIALLELALDRPHGWIPRSVGGFEPFLRQPPAAPVILQADVRGSLGAGALAEVDAAGELRAALRWPDLPALRLHVALVRWRIVDAAGDATVAVTPSAKLRF